MQATPAYLDREATLDIVADEIAKAAARRRPTSSCSPSRSSPATPTGSGATTPGATPTGTPASRTRPSRFPARRSTRSAPQPQAADVWVALGITERSRSGTLYNAVVYIDDAARSPVFTASSSRPAPNDWSGPTDKARCSPSVDIGGVKVGSLICWENYMPLARAALYEKGIDVLLAPTWDNSDEWVPTLRHIAKEGQVFVVGVTAFLRGCDVPRDLPGADEIYGGADDFMSKGNTTIVAPGGEIIDGPLIGEAGTVTATLDLDRIAAGRRAFDPTGHYARPDVLSLTINTNGDSNE